MAGTKPCFQDAATGPVFSGDGPGRGDDDLLTNEPPGQPEISELAARLSANLSAIAASNSTAFRAWVSV